MNDFTRKVVKTVNEIPYGKVMSYGQIANCCGNNRAARQVSRILHSMSRKHNLPWHRVINSQGKISLNENNGFELQKSLLEAEGILFNKNSQVDFKIYGYEPLY